MRFKCAETIIICLQSSRPLLGPHGRRKIRFVELFHHHQRHKYDFSLCVLLLGGPLFFSVVFFFCSLLARGTQTKGVKVSSPFGPKKKRKKTVGVFFYTSFYLYIQMRVLHTSKKKSKKKRERERTNAYIYTHIYIVMTRAGVRGLLYGVLIQNYARVGVLPRRVVSFSFPFFSFLSFFLSFFEIELLILHVLRRTAKTS